MTTAQPAHQPLSLWPGVAIVALQWLLRFGVPTAFPEYFIYAVGGSLVLTLLFILWWAFLSRAPMVERWVVILFALGATALSMKFLDKSIATAGQGMMFPLFCPPFFCLTVVASLVLSRHLSPNLRRASVAVAIVLTCLGWMTVRINGITGDAHPDYAWRWAKTDEAKLLAQPVAILPVTTAASNKGATAALAPEPASPEVNPKTIAKEAEDPDIAPPLPTKVNFVWPGFRGPHRDGVVPGTRINTDWAAKPPVELWRRAIGPGWSSFVVNSELIYTQEQRGDDEMITCYNASTGKPVWAHRDPARFWDSHAGAGPRGTPAFHSGRVFAMGATGIVNALNASDGALIWTRNAAQDTGAKIPGWGYAASPLAVDDIVVVATSGILAAYDAATGEPRWTGPKGGDSYSSPHPATIDGVEQILLLSATGVTSIAPTDGKVLWKYEWKSDTRIMQPVVMPGGHLLLTKGDALGGDSLRRIAIAHTDAGWTTEERWTSPGLKPNFSDSAVHGGHIFGFDGAILSCVDLTDGKRKWKGGRYGHGQFVLLSDQGLLLVLSEEGELALAKADPTGFTELSKIRVFDDKSWSHPVVAGDRLFMRNSSEMVAYRLPAEAGR